jgi:hypothetical protein
MEISVYREAIIRAYLKRDIEALIRLISDMMTARWFSALVREYVKQSKISSTKSLKIGDIAGVLLQEAEEQIEESGRLDTEGTFFDTGKDLKKRFGAIVSEIYLDTRMPSEFLSKIRSNSRRDEVTHLSESLIELHKNEMIRIGSGREAIVKILQKYSNFPVKHANTLVKLIEKLHARVKSSYRYLPIKPYFLPFIVRDEGDAKEQKANSHATVTENYSELLKEYVNSGNEPSLLEQLNFWITLKHLLQQIKKHSALHDDEYKIYQRIVARIWGYRTPNPLDPRLHRILEDLLAEVNTDLDAIRRCLALTFVEEYQTAEDQMKIRHRTIESELAYTKAYLMQSAQSSTQADSAEQEKLRIAEEKLVGLDGIFRVSPALEQAAETKPFLELERAALGISTAVSAEQLTAWIRIYSILFTNSEFLEYTDKKLDFSTMRRLISNLSTYHLILNIAELKTIVERGLSQAAEEKSVQFKRFHEALKLRLHNLMGRSKETKTLQEMIEDLEFIDNESVQFVIADTFKGFQTIADAFRETANDYFVKDREELMKESRDLYNQICDQCMKNFMQLSRKPVVKKGKAVAKDDSVDKKSWLTRLVSS